MALCKRTTIVPGGLAVREELPIIVRVTPAIPLAVTLEQRLVVR
jgi:hypothetical protein